MSKDQDEHGRYLELAMNGDRSTEEVKKAIEHVDGCPECGERVARLVELFQKAGILADTPSED